MQRNLSVRECIMPLFLALGVSPTRIGYKYLKCAVLYYGESGKSVGRAYARIAEENGVSVASVEKTVRASLSAVSGERMKSVLGAPYKATAAAFIATVADYLSYEDNRRALFELTDDAP